MRQAPIYHATKLLNSHHMANKNDMHSIPTQCGRYQTGMTKNRPSYDLTLINKWGGVILPFLLTFATQTPNKLYKPLFTIYIFTKNFQLTCR